VDGVPVPQEDIRPTLKNIHVLISMTAHGEDVVKHLEEAKIATGRLRGTCSTTSSARSSNIRRRRNVPSDRGLGKSRTK
jgi:hypothetical protein